MLEDRVRVLEEQVAELKQALSTELGEWRREREDAAAEHARRIAAEDKERRQQTRVALVNRGELTVEQATAQEEAERRAEEAAREKEREGEQSDGGGVARTEGDDALPDLSAWGVPRERADQDEPLARRPATR